MSYFNIVVSPYVCVFPFQRRHYTHFCAKRQRFSNQLFMFVVFVNFKIPDNISNKLKNPGIQPNFSVLKTIFATDVINATTLYQVFWKN